MFNLSVCSICTPVSGHFPLRCACISVHSPTQSGDLAQEAQSILVTNQQWGMGESLRTGGQGLGVGGGWGQGGRSDIFPHGAGFMNDLLIVDLMESGGPTK